MWPLDPKVLVVDGRELQAGEQGDGRRSSGVLLGVQCRNLQAQKA